MRKQEGKTKKDRQRKSERKGHLARVKRTRETV